MQLLRN